MPILQCDTRTGHTQRRQLNIYLQCLMPLWVMQFSHCSAEFQLSTHCSPPAPGSYWKRGGIVSEMEVSCVGQPSLDTTPWTHYSTPTLQLSHAPLHAAWLSSIAAHWHVIWPQQNLINQKINVKPVDQIHLKLISLLFRGKVNIN